MLESVPVIVLHGRHDDLPALPPGALQLEQGGRGRLPPLGQEHHEAERLEGFLQQALKVHHHSVEELLAEGRIGFEGTALGFEVQYGSGV